MGFESFNLCHLRRAPGHRGLPAEPADGLSLEPQGRYRSDSTFLERLHWEGAVDLAPETLAERIGNRFRR